VNNALRIRVAKSAGFCFGVRRAIKIAMELAGSGRPVFMLGDLVHNENVIRDIEAAGIRKLKRLGCGRGRTLLIRAHGAPARVLQQARRRGYRVVDATCPMVKEIHRTARALERQGRHVIVIGDPRHEEVLGILGQLRGPGLVVESLEQLPAKALRRIRRAGVVVQSTQNQARVAPLLEALRARIPDLRFCDTICRPTRLKQAEVRALPLAHDVVIVIGSRTSANTRRLYEIARSLNPRTRWIQDASELKPAWFRGAHSVGVTAGASTPQTLIEAVVERLRRIRSASSSAPEPA
jgi:4-hydroxy-3-methylbut-2-enyl diphosphate reductase